MMGNEGESASGGCAENDWAAYQDILLNLNPSNIDDATRRFNSSPAWGDGSEVARLVLSVVGTRVSWLDLVEFMMRLHLTRGYPAILGSVSRIEQSIRDPSLVHIAKDAIAGAGDGQAVRAAIQDPARRQLATVCAEAVADELQRMDDFASVRAGILALRATAEATSDQVATPGQ
jgi:hypothetical protein